jgi:hypothetical protein
VRAASSLPLYRAMRRSIVGVLVLAVLAASCGEGVRPSGIDEGGGRGPLQWTTAQRIDDTATHDGAPVLGVSPAGDVVVVWSRDVIGGRGFLFADGLRASRFVPGRGWSAVATIPHSLDKAATSLAVDDRGAAVVVGPVSASDEDGGRRGWSSLSEADGAWSDPELVPFAVGEVLAPLVVRPRPSLAVAAWIQYADRNARVFASTREGGGWTPAQPLDAEGRNVNSLDLVTDGRGRALATWYEATEGPGGPVLAAMFDGRQWSAPHPLTETGTFPAAAFAGSDAVVLWNSAEGTMVRTTRDGVSWSPPQDGPSARVSTYDLRVAFDSAGNALAVWRQQNAQTTFELWGAYYGRQRGWTEPRLLGISPVADAEVVFAGEGRGLILRSAGGLVCAQTYTPLASWTEPERCLGPGAEVRAGADAAGRVTAVWTNAGALWFSRLEAPR